MLAQHKFIEVSYPPEDHDDRNALYALRVDLEVSCGWPANKRMRLLAMEEMQKLIDKYPDGYEGWEAQQAAMKKEKDQKKVESSALPA